MATTRKKVPSVTAVYGESQGSPVVRLDVKVRGDSVTVIVGLDKRSVQAYFGKPGLVAVATGTTAPKGPRGTPVDVFAAAPESSKKRPARPKSGGKKLGDGGPTPPPPIKPPS